MTVSVWLPRLLFSVIILSATLTKAELVTNFVDTSTCHDGLAWADANGDNRIGQDEYLAFIQFIGPLGFLADIDSLEDAPWNLRVNFITLSCKCQQNGGDAACCIGDNAHIPIDGINSPDFGQLSFLVLVCSSTNRYVNDVLESYSTPISTISSTISPTPSPVPAASTVSPEPTQSPSAIPTTSPRPTTSPSSSPTSIPSAVPSAQPSSHTVEGIGTVAQTIYTVVIVNGLTENVPESSYIPDLIAGMNVMAVEVASEVDFGSSDGGIRRRLVVRVSLPTFIDGVHTDTPELVDNIFELGACPSDMAAPLDDDRCKQVTASVGLFLDDEAPQAARQLYQAALDQAVSQGRLQDTLMEINPDSPVRILTGKTSGANGVNGSRSTEPERLSVDPAVWIVIGLAMVGFMVAIFIVRKRALKPGVDEVKALSSIPSGATFELDSSAEQDAYSAEKERADEEAGNVQSGREAVLGATKTDYGQNYGGKPHSSSVEVGSNGGGSQDYMQALSEGGQGSGGRSRSSSISSFGQQSGWPSYSTSSIYPDGMPGDELYSPTFSTRMIDLDTVNKELYNAESSYSSHQSSTTGTCDSSLKVMLDEQKAAELHRLIEGGNWEGVVRAASIFEVDGKSSHGSISHQGLQGGSASGTESVHSFDESSFARGSATGSVSTGSGITPHTLPF